VHGVAAEALDVYAMIEGYVAIVAVVVEDLQKSGIFEILLKLHDDSLGIGVVVNEQTGTRPEVQVWPCKH